MVRKFITTLALSLLFTSAFARSDLLDIYFKALKFDPAFQAAFATRLSTEEIYPQARAAFLPLLSANAAHTQRSQFLDQYNSSGGRVGPFGGTGNFRFHQKSYTISLTEPLFNYSNWKNLQVANATTKNAVATYNSALQDLIVRTANAYLNVLQAEDTLRFTRAEKRANYRQLEQAQHRYRVGLDAVTSVYDAQASYDGVKAREIIAKNDVDNSLESLREITGSYQNDLAKLTKNLPLLKPEPADPTRWASMAERYNFSIQAARHAKDAAKHTIDVRFAGHLPTLDMTGQLNGTRGGSAVNSGMSQRNKIVALELNVPIFAGGFVNSQVRQARYDYERAKAELERTQRQVISATHQSYNSVIAGISTIFAGRQAVKSASSSVESTEAAFKVGTRTMVNVLDAQRDLYDAERALARSQYDYIRSILSLKQAAGSLNVADVEEINSWLDTETAHTTMERYKTKGLIASAGPTISEAPMRVYHKLTSKHDESQTPTTQQVSENKPADLSTAEKTQAHNTPKHVATTANEAPQQNWLAHLHDRIFFSHTGKQTPSQTVKSVVSSTSTETPISSSNITTATNTETSIKKIAVDSSNASSKKSDVTIAATNNHKSKHQNSPVIKHKSIKHRASRKVTHKNAHTKLTTHRKTHSHHTKT